MSLRRRLRLSWWVVPPLIPGVAIGLAALTGNPQLIQVVAALFGLPLIAIVGLVVRQVSDVPRLDPTMGVVVVAVVVVANWYMLAVIARAVWRFVHNLRAARHSDDPDA